MSCRFPKTDSPSRLPLTYPTQGGPPEPTLERACLFLLRSQTMIARSKKAARLISLIAITITSLVYVTLAQITHAERPEPQTEKVSSLLKGNKHRADDTLTVIVTLNGPISGRLNALLKQNDVRLRREMKNLRSISVSLPFG